MSSEGAWVAYARDLSWEPPEGALEHVRGVLASWKLLPDREPYTEVVSGTVQASWHWEDQDRTDRVRNDALHRLFENDGCLVLRIVLGPRVFVADDSMDPTFEIRRLVPPAEGREVTYGDHGLVWVFRHVFDVPSIAFAPEVDIHHPEQARFRHPETGAVMTVPIRADPGFRGWFRSHVLFALKPAPASGSEKQKALLADLSEATGTEWGEYLWSEG